MIQSETFVPMAYFKKEAYTGSQKGMRYYVAKEEEEFVAVIYPEPYGFAATPDDKKTEIRFPFTAKGREAVLNWLNEQYDARKAEWDKAARK